MDLYATEPDVVTDVNQAIVSYDKRGAILEDHSMQLNTRIADELGYIWLPTLATNFIRTSRAADPIDPNKRGSMVAGMTGTRKLMTYQDFIDLASLMDRMEIPDDGNRRILIYTDQQAEIKKIAEFRDFDKTGVVGQFANGSIGKIQNMHVYKRSRPLLYDNSGNPVKKAYGSAVLPTDNIAALAWHPSFVRYAEGVVQVYYEAKKVGYQGDMMNAAVRGGGMDFQKRRTGRSSPDSTTGISQTRSSQIISHKIDDFENAATRCDGRGALWTYRGCLILCKRVYQPGYCDQCPHCKSGRVSSHRHHCHSDCGGRHPDYPLCQACLQDQDLVQGLCRMASGM